MSRHSTLGSAWVVPWPCTAHHDCTPPLRAARAHAMVPKTSPCKNLQSRVPARLLPAPPAPRRSQVCSNCMGRVVPAYHPRPAALTRAVASAGGSILRIEGITSRALEAARRVAQVRAARIERWLRYLSMDQHPSAPAVPPPPAWGPSHHRKLEAFSVRLTRF